MLTVIDINNKSVSKKKKIELHYLCSNLKIVLMYAMSRKGIMGIGNHISQKRVKFPEQPCQAKYF